MQSTPGETIKTWRKARGLTQGELGERMDMPQSAISKRERGETAIDLPFVEAFATALQLSLDERRELGALLLAAA